MSAIDSQRLIIEVFNCWVSQLLRPFYSIVIAVSVLSKTAHARLIALRCLIQGYFRQMRLVLAFVYDDERLLFKQTYLRRCSTLWGQ